MVPREYRGADVTVDSSYPNSLTFIKDEKTGKESLIIAVKLAMSRGRLRSIG